MNSKKINCFDVVAIIIITIIYSIVSFVNLGDAAVPRTQPDMGSGEKKNI